VAQFLRSKSGNASFLDKQEICNSPVESTGDDDGGDDDGGGKHELEQQLQPAERGRMQLIQHASSFVSPVARTGVSGHPQ
jgi:hypothetical protein